MENNFYKKSFITVDSLSIGDIRVLFQRADLIKSQLEKGIVLENLKGKVLSALFYEPSSRTFSSFISAMQKLGGGIIPLNSMMNTSVYKGETLEDTIKVFCALSDVIVLRHFQKGAPNIACEVAAKPIINAGDGIGEHPTQALLDCFTINHHVPVLSDLTVGMLGDLLNGRTVHSLSKALAKLGVKKFIFITPKNLSMPQDILEVLTHQGVAIVETDDLSSVFGDLDVIYSTRVQKERFSDQNEYERLKFSYIITKDLMKKAKKNAVLMHPLPRVGEIAPDVDDDPRALYFREQIGNGLYVRMALLDLILNK